MITVTQDGKDIFYDVFGKKDAEQTLVFLNGLTQSTDSWAFVTPAFKADYRIVLIDLIFQGKSEKTGHWRNFDQHANDVVHVLNAVGVKQVLLAGISYGSLVAQHLAHNYPERVKALILISTFAHKTPYYEAIELSWWRALEAGGYNLMLDIMLPSVLSESYFANPLVSIQKMKEARKEVNENSQAIFNLMMATKQREDYRQELQKLNVPCIVIQGERDFLLPVHLASEVHRNIKGSSLHIIPNAGHTLNLEFVPELIAAMKNFLDQIK